MVLIFKMVIARLHCTIVLLLYLKICHGQQTLNNQNININNAKSLQQQSLQRPPNINPIPNGGMNINLAQSNLQAANLQQSPNLSAPKQGNLQQSLNLPSNLQSQSASVPQNNLQITKIGFTPVSSSTVNNPYGPMQFPNTGVNANVQVIQPQNMGISRSSTTQMTNSPISASTLADLVALKGQSSLLSLLNSQNVGQAQNQPIVMNTIPAQNQLTDMQKQILVRSMQSQNSGQNQQGLNLVQAQARIGNMDSQQSIGLRGIQGTNQQAQAIVTPLGNQPAYITVQAQPLTSYLQTQSPQVPVEEEPSLLSIILSELGPQYSVNSAFPPKKGSKTNLKSLIPLIINMLKEKNNCACRNCGCPNNACQNNPCQNNAWPSNMSDQMAQIFGGYSTQMKYGPNSDDTSARIKKNDDEESRHNDKERTDNNKKTVAVESEEMSEEDDSEYIDDD